MAGTPEGGKKAFESRDKNEQRAAASKGGQHSHSGGQTQQNRSQQSAAGQKGGQQSQGGRGRERDEE